MCENTSSLTLNLTRLRAAACSACTAKESEEDESEDESGSEYSISNEEIRESFNSDRRYNSTDSSMMSPYTSIYCVCRLMNLIIPIGLVSSSSLTTHMQ